MVYARKRMEWHPKRSARTGEQDKYYKNPDNDPRGSWNSATYTCNKSRSERPGLYYPIINPNTGNEILPDENVVWKFSREKHEENVREGLLYWGVDGQAQSPRLKQFLSNAKDIVPRSIWPYAEVGSTQAATTELRALFGGAAFPYPKPVDLVKKAIYQSTQDGDIILDFFAGSSTTAHAVMQLNSEDGGSRKYIIVQMPELTEKDSEAFIAGYCSIADIGKERIRRAGDAIITEWQKKYTNHTSRLSFDDNESASLPDVGFRVFKLDSSNLQKWDGSFQQPENADLFLDRAARSLDNMKPDRRDIDMVYEVFLKYGVPLTEKLATLQIQGKTFYVVGDTGYLMICLDKDIVVETVEETVKTHTPGAIIFADECFMDDNELTNAGLALDKAHVEFRWI